MSVERFEPYLQPIRKSVTVSRPVSETFEVFTAGIARWWPLARYSINESRAKSCGIDPFVSGEVYEVREDGVRCPWGKVLVWEPPHRLVLSWHPGREPEEAQEVEVRFTGVEGSTRVDLEHRNWQKLGEAAAAARKSYDGGWEHVLGEAFVKACAA